MIKARGTSGEQEVLMLGLSFADLDRLKDNRPIEIDATPYGFAGRIVLFSGQDDFTMVRVLRRISPDLTEISEKDADPCPADAPPS